MGFQRSIEFSLTSLAHHRQGIVTKNDVLHRRTSWSTIRRSEQVLSREHKNSRFSLRLRRQRNVNSHLVTVKVCVIHVTDQWVNLNRLSINQNRFKRLNTKSVQRRRTVQKNRVLSNDLFQTIPNRWVHSINHPLRGLDVLSNSLFNQGLHYERLEQFKCHFLRNSALVKLQVWPDDNNRSTRVVNPLTKKVLSESSFLTLQHVRERLERSCVRSNDRTCSSTVINQSINCFLKQSLFVVDNRFRSMNLDNLLQPVVSVDNPSIKIVQVRSRKSTSIQLNHRSQFRRDNRNHTLNHPIWLRF